MNKFGYFFSLDALIALLLVVAIILLVELTPRQVEQESFLQQDALKVLSDLRLFETNNSYVESMISSGKIKNLNNSILEQIGEFYALEDPEARNLALEFLPIGGNIGIWFNNEYIASRNDTSYTASKNIWVSRQIISGIQRGSNVTGYSSRAYLTKNALMKYYYFGGYVGDGNITAIIQYNGTIKSAFIEVSVSNNFSLYINNQFSGNYAAMNSTFAPVIIDLSPHLSKFSSGDNTIEFLNGPLYIGGGYIVIDYETDVNYQSPTRYTFPGITGIINLYDSFTIPGSLNDMEIFLHYYAVNQTVFLAIGNTTVYNGSSSGDAQITISNAQLDSLLNYDEISNQTIPLRLSLENVSQTLGGGNADVILVTDVSGSMGQSLDGNSGIVRNCSDELLYENSTERLSLAKCLAKNFTRIVLNSSGNRLGLASFARNLEDAHALSDNLDSLLNHIDSYDKTGGTCICCGINGAYNLLIPVNVSRKRFVVVMTDGTAKSRCTSYLGPTPQNASCGGKMVAFNGTGTSGDGCSSGCTTSNNNANFNNTIWSANRIHAELGANLSTIGMRTNDCFNANKTLHETALAGGGIFQSANDANELFDAYESLAESIVLVSYLEQTILSSSIQGMILYPDSFITFNYTKKPVPYGIALSYRTNGFGNNITQGIFAIPGNSTPVEVNALSYSGSKWTDNVTLNGWRFLLSDFGQDYTKLGDPFVVNIPEQYVNEGDNIISIRTGISPQNSFGGSEEDKVSYTVVKNVLSYSPILYTASGCTWSIMYDDDSNETIKVPGNYSGGQTCSFMPGNILYNSNDAIDVATYNLMRLLDVNGDDKVDTKFSQQSLEISSNEVEGIPFTWSSEAQVRVWR